MACSRFLQGKCPILFFEWFGHSHKSSLFIKIHKCQAEGLRLMGYWPCLETQYLFCGEKKEMYTVCIEVPKYLLLVLVLK